MLNEKQLKRFKEFFDLNLKENLLENKSKLKEAGKSARKFISEKTK